MGGKPIFSACVAESGSNASFASSAGRLSAPPGAAVRLLHWGVPGGSGATLVGWHGGGNGVATGWGIRFSTLLAKEDVFASHPALGTWGDAGSGGGWRGRGGGTGGGT